MAHPRTPQQWLAVVLIRIYQWVISPLLGPRCRFTPTCSQYMIDAICLHGLIKGIWLGGKRLLKCHPIHSGGHDPVPQPQQSKRRK